MQIQGTSNHMPVAAEKPAVQPNQNEAAQAQQQQQQAQQDANIEQTVKRVKKYVDIMKEARVQMNYDEELDRVIIKYLSDGGEIINQIPSKDFISFEREFVRSLGLLLDKKA